MILILNPGLVRLVLRWELEARNFAAHLACYFVSRQLRVETVCGDGVEGDRDVGAKTAVFAS